VLVHGHVAGGHERELLGLVVLDRGAPVEGVEVILEEALRLEVAFRFARWNVLGGELHDAPGAAPVDRAVDVARDELERRVLVGRAALIVDGDPAGEVAPVVGRIDHHHVVGLPVDPAREVGGFDLLRRRLGIAEHPDQRRLGHEVLRE